MEAIGKGGPIMKLAVFMLGRHTNLLEIQNAEAMIMHCQRMIAIDNMWKDDTPVKKDCEKTAEQMAQSEVI
jgi:methyl coenzyme M reductase beta subunit